MTITGKKPLACQGIKLADKTWMQLIENGKQVFLEIDEFVKSCLSRQGGIFATKEIRKRLG